MTPSTPASPVSKKTYWISIVLSVLPCLLLLFSAAMKLLHPPQLDEGFAHLQLPISHALGLGLFELACTIIYLIPRTATLGAILVTGYLGGAIATHVRIGETGYAHLVLGVAIWGGLYLRDPRLRALIPFVR